MKTKICNKCGEEKSLDNFSWRNKAKGKKNSWCRECYANWDKNKYEKNKEYFIDKANNQKIKIQKFLYNYLKIHPCVDCGESNPIVLEFDHKNNKKFNLGEASRIGGFLKIQEEVEKCDVRCANCHRKKTAKEFKQYKYLFWDEEDGNPLVSETREITFNS